MATLAHLEEAAAALAQAQASMTDVERFNMGWHVTSSLSSVREAIYTLSHPERMIKMED